MPVTAGNVEELNKTLLGLGFFQFIMVALALLVVILETQRSRKSEYNYFALAMTFFFLHILTAIFFAEPIALIRTIVSDWDKTPSVLLVANHAFLMAGLLLLAYALVLPKLMSPASDSFAQFLRLSVGVGLFLSLASLLYGTVFSGAKIPFQGSPGDLILHLAVLTILSFSLFVIAINLPKAMLFLKVALGLFVFAKVSAIANTIVQGAFLFYTEYSLEGLAYTFIVMAVNQFAGEDLRVLYDQLRRRTTMLEDATQRLTKLNQLSTDLLRTTDIVSLSERILDSIAIAMGYRYSFLLLLDQKEKLLRGWKLEEPSGKLANFINIPLSSDHFLVNAFFKGKTLFYGEATRLPDSSFIQNYQYSKNLVTIPLQAKKETFCWDLHNCDRTRCPIRTWALPTCWLSKEDCPFYGPDEVGVFDRCINCPAFNIIGLLVIDNRQSSIRIDEKNLPFIETFANQAGIALHNATLMDNLSAEINFREATFKNLPTGVIVVDRKGVIATVNPAEEKILRLNRDELVGKRLDTVRVVNDMPTLIEIVASTFKGGNVYEDYGKVWDLTHPDRMLQLAIRISPLPQQDEIGGVIILADDITDKLQLERQLFHSEKLATIGQMAAGIAHEVNNPLAGVSAFLQVLAARLEAGNPEKKPLEAALKSIGRASNTIKDLLKFAKPPPSEKKPTDINQLITDSLVFIGYQPRYEKIHVIKELQEGLPNLYIDPGQISQVLDNIIINALQAMGAEGTLKVGTGLSGRWVHIYVTDNGTGIPAKNIPRIFDPFFTTKEAGAGTGLGLSTCDRIVSEHGGTIAVYSIEKKETTFIIRLPVQEQEMARIQRKRMFEDKAPKQDAAGVPGRNPDASAEGGKDKKPDG